MVITLTDLETRPTLAKIHGKTKKERHHLQHLYHNTTGSDVALSFDHYKVPAHKPWLSKGSHLFKVAFQSGFTVATAAEYKIEGYAPEVVFAMIKHLYCLPYLGPHSSSYDKLNLLVGVYQIANEYQIETLTENATKNYSFFLADLHQTPEFTLAVQHVAQLYQEEDLPLDLAQAVVDVCHLVLSRREHDDLLRVLEEHQPIHTGLACLRRSTFHHASNLLTVDTPRAHDRAPTDWTPTLKEIWYPYRSLNTSNFSTSTVSKSTRPSIHKSFRGAVSKSTAHPRLKSYVSTLSSQFKGLNVYPSTDDSDTPVLISVKAPPQRQSSMRRQVR